MAMSTLVLILLLLLAVASVFSIAAQQAAARHQRRLAQRLLEIHDMLVTLTREDDKLREIMLRQALAEDPRDGGGGPRAAGDAAVRSALGHYPEMDERL